jgi:large subunit ribosomal protein L13
MGAQVQKKQKRSIRTYSQKPAEVSRDWFLVDASELSLGRLSTIVAKTLSGKGKVTYTPHVDGGDNVIVINAAKLKVTGSKLQTKRYYNYSGYPGGLREQTLAQVLQKNPFKAIQNAVYGMLPKNKLRPAMMQRLRIFSGEEHKHTAQNPQPLNLSSATKKENK